MSAQILDFPNMRMQRSRAVNQGDMDRLSLDVDFRVWCHKQNLIARDHELPYVDRDELKRQYLLRDLDGLPV